MNVVSYKQNKYFNNLLLFHLLLHLQVQVVLQSPLALVQLESQIHLKKIIKETINNFKELAVQLMLTIQVNNIED